MGRLGFRILIVFAVLAIVAVTGIASWKADNQEAPVVLGPRKVGELVMLETPRPAPTAPFRDPEGNPTTLAAFRGKLLLVNLWATWCGPCVRELPSLNGVNARMGGPTFAVLAVSEDRTHEAPRQFLAAGNIRHLPAYLDERGELSRALGATGLPTSYLIDAEGRIVAFLEGATEWDTNAMEAKLRALMPSAPPAGSRPGSDP